MAITKVNKTPPAAHGEKRFFAPVSRNLPDDRGSTATPKSDQGYAPGRRSRTRLTRPLAPFLAQLSLQYDDMTAARRKRRERLEAASRSYAADCGGEIGAQAHTQDLKA